MDRLQAMKVFARVVEEGGFAAAARAMDMSPPVVTRMVAELEQHLGTRLLQRTTRKLALTVAGDAYLQRVRSILHEIDDAEAAAVASTRDLRGTIRLCTVPVLANHFLAPLVARWHANFPRLLLDVHIDPYASARVDEFDVTLMIAGEDFDANVVARPLLHGEAILVASPDYLRRRGTPQHPDDLLAHDFLRDSAVSVRAPGGMGRKLPLKPASGQGGGVEVDPPAVMQSVSTELLMRAAIDGMGFAVTSRLLAEPYLVQGALVRLLPDWIISRYTVYAALPTGRLLPARTRVLLDFMTEQVPLVLENGGAQPA
ncbi:LysR family transcriptional regulator [Acidovorax lacteus]|uniref:LysR family transcriptional regulator n=1 Tax=Acidovorax lacteus TaxID=1924988 RepID=A0ABP8L7K7_9BURK